MVNRTVNYQVFLLIQSLQFLLNTISTDSYTKTLFLQTVVSLFPVDDVQVSCYRILNSLYILGTNKSIYVER